MESISAESARLGPGRTTFQPWLERLSRIVLIGAACCLLAACMHTTLELLEPGKLRAAQLWALAFRFDSEVSISDVPLEEGHTGQMKWNQRSARERVFLKDVAYQLSIEHGIRIVEKPGEADALMAFHLVEDGLYELFTTIDIFFMDPSMDKEFARLHIANEINLSDYDLARWTADELAKVFRGKR